MKRPSDDDGKGSSSGSKAEEFAQKLLNNLPKLLIYLGSGLVILIVITLIILKFSSPKH
jgi:hypothetical protein